MAHFLTMSLTLFEYCEKADVTIADVARSAGIEKGWLYKIAKGERGFSPETADKISRATSGKVTPSDLTRVRMAWLASAKGSKKNGSVVVPEGAA